MDVNKTASWMLLLLQKDGCLYQDDVVDKLVKSASEELLRENSDGNLVLDRKLLNAFRKLTEANVVWVNAGKYWRFRVLEDEQGRDARG